MNHEELRLTFAWLIAGAAASALVISIYSMVVQLSDRRGEWIVETPPTEATRLDVAAQAICGPNSAWEFVNATTLQCYTKKGNLAGKKVLP